MLTTKGVVLSKVDGVGIAFCGGGFRSFAEVAAIEDMQRSDVRYGAVAGTSMGSLVAALAASGVSTDRMAELLVAMDKRTVEEGVLRNMPLKVLNVISNKGMVDSAILEDYAREVLEGAGIRTFADFVMPVAITAVDIVSGELFVFTNDEELFAADGGNWNTVCDLSLDVAKCCACSGSYPLVITPTKYLGRTFMDGGCRMNLPTPLFDRSMVDAVVGVGLIRKPRLVEDITPLNIAMRTMGCGANQLDRIHANAADLYINLPVSGDDAFQAGTGAQVIDEARQMLRDNPPDWNAVRPSMLESIRKRAVDAFYNMVKTVPKSVKMS